MEPSCYIGIDLGTTNSVVAYLREGFAPEIAEVNGGRLLRSAVMYNNDGSTVTGKACFTSSKPILKGNVITCFKRIIGRRIDDLFVEKVKGSCKAAVVDNGKQMAAFRVPNAKEVVMPEAVAARLLDEMYDAAMKKIDKGKVVGVIVTVPAAYNNEQRCATKRAIKMSKLSSLKVRLADEPSAAAVCYSMGEKYKNGYLVVYDLGGGTFDVSVVKLRSETEFDVLKTDGDIGIGGEAFDDYIMQELRSFIQTNAGEDEDPLKYLEQNIEGLSEEKCKEKLNRSLDLLREKCREAKESLSAFKDGVAPIDLFDFYEKIATEFPKPKTGNEYDDDDGLIDEDVEYGLTTETLNRLIKEDIEKTIGITLRCINDAGLTKDDICGVVMVGGSSMIPYVQKRVEKEFGGGRVKYTNPSECVALGASMLASKTVHNRTTRDLCITASGGTYNTVIPRGTEYPTHGEKVFNTGQFNIGSINCSAYEYDTEYRLMDKMTVEDDDMEGEVVPVEFQYNVTDEGICYLTVRNTQTGRVLLKDKPLTLNEDVI